MKKQHKQAYEWRDGFQFPGDPQEVGEALSEIDAAHGCLQPAVVVNAAKPKKSPLHRYFEWDDSEAARKYRDDQARHLIRAVRVVTNDPEMPSRPAFVHVRQGNHNSYRRPEVVVKDAEMWESVMRDAALELRSVERKMAELVRMEGKSRKRTAGQIRRSVALAANKAEKAVGAGQQP